MAIPSNDVSIMKPFDDEITSAVPVSIILMYPDSFSGSESTLPVVLLPLAAALSSCTNTEPHALDKLLYSR
jgi:hypothetical protein